MNLVERLRQEAELLAATLKKETAEVALEKREIESKTINGNKTRLAWLNKELQAGEAASRRLSEYNPQPHQHLCCPYCWMLEDKTIILRPIEGPAEVISCCNCAAEHKLE